MANDRKNNEERKDLEQILSELGGGLKVSINRVLPRWCDGHLDTIELSEDESLSVDDLREQYGGRKLRIRITDPDNHGKLVALREIKFPDPPRDGGIELEEPDGKGKEKTDRVAELMATFMQSQAETQKQIALMQTQHHQQMLENIQKQNENMQGLLRERIADQQAQQSSGTQGLKETMEMVEFLDGLKERLGANSGGEPVNPMYKQILDMGETFFAFKLDQERAKFAAQQQQQSQQPPELPERRPKQRQTPQNGGSRQMGDMEFLSEAAKRFEQMSLSQQQQVAQMFFKKLNTEENDSSAEYQEPLESESSQLDSPTEPDIDLDPDDLDELRQHGDPGATT